MGEEIIRSYGHSRSKLQRLSRIDLACSVNDEVVHGIPHKEHFLDEGDIVIWMQEWSTKDTIRCSPDLRHRKIDDDAKTDWSYQTELLRNKFAKAGNHLNDISAAIQKYAESHFVLSGSGHGIGSIRMRGSGDSEFCKKKKRNSLAARHDARDRADDYEGSYEVSGSMMTGPSWRKMAAAAHYENTILITENEPEILSL